MYGRRVHDAVLRSGDSVSGVTVHLVDEEYDRGPIVSQRQVPVLNGDTPESLAQRVLEQEHTIYVETLQKIAVGEIKLDQLQGHTVSQAAPQIGISEIHSSA